MKLLLTSKGAAALRILWMVLCLIAYVGWAYWQDARDAARKEREG